MFLPKALITTAAVLAVAAPASQAATDTVVATTAKPTPLAASHGRVLYSAWDGSKYRLTQLDGDPIDVAGSSTPFVVDLGGDTAVYPRDGKLFAYDFGTRTELDLHADGAVAGSVSGRYIYFARKHGIYRQTRHTRAVRIAKKEALSLDARNSRYVFSGSREWSHEPWLGTRTALTRLTHVPGGGASPDFFDALNPSFSGNAIYWMLSRQGEHNVSEIHRYNRKLDRDERVALEIPGAASGFAYDRGHAYYSLGTEIHELTGLTFEKAPKIKMYD
jgi:hypothetical protein